MVDTVQCTMLSKYGQFDGKKEKGFSMNVILLRVMMIESVFCKLCIAYSICWHVLQMNGGRLHAMLNAKKKKDFLCVQITRDN